MKIRQMQIEDLETIKDILQTEFDDFWNYNIFKAELENQYSKYFCAEENGEILGFAGVWQSIDVMHITNIVVRKDKRGIGIGNKLLEKLIEYSKKPEITSITLEVHEENNIAQSLYKKHNFEQVGIRKNYYKDKNGIILTLNFKKTKERKK